VLNRELLKSREPPRDLEASKLVWLQSLEETKSGWLVGPFHSEKEVSDYLQTPQWVATRRFPLHQKNKTRVIDDCKESGVNDALKTTEKLNLMDVEALTVLLTHVAEVAVKRSISVKLQCDSEFNGEMNTQWLDDNQEWTWQGRALDLAHAYKQLGYSRSSIWASVVQAFDTDKMVDAYFISPALMFGSTASVYFFNRVSRAIWFLLVRYFHVLTINFYDDFPMIEPSKSAAVARSVTESFLKLLGWHIAEGHKSLPFDSSFEALGIVVDLRLLNSGSFNLSMKPSRIEELKAIASQILSSVKINRTDCQSLIGKLLFVRGQLAGNALRSIIDALLFHVHKTSSVMASESVLFAVEMLSSLLENSEPKTITWSDPLQPVVVFTDGASEGDHNEHTSHTVGALLIDVVSNTRIVLDGFVHATLVDLWCKHVGDKFICQVEAYPVLCLMHMYSTLLRHRRVLFFLDNDASRHAFIKCTSQSNSMKALAYAFYNISSGCRPWFARVPTESNPADLPSRQQAALAAQLFNCQHVGALSLDEASLDSVVKHTVPNHKRKADDSN
jgi:hypothetical protein